MMQYDVISFGSAILDVFVRSPVAKVTKTPLVETHQALVFPYGSKCEVDRLKICSGGGGTNTAVGFARLGLKAAVVARCGWDFAGKIIRQELKKEGVDDSLFVQLEGEKTDFSTILMGPDGGRTILVYRGGTKLEGSVIDLSKLDSRWFYTTSLEGNLDLMAKLISLAQKKGIKIASNPGRREISQKEKLLKIAQGLDILILNREEAAKLTGLLINDEKVFSKIFSLFPKTTVIVTEGNSGVKVNRPGKGSLQIKGVEVGMVDSTGAGDGFGSGLVAGLAKGFRFEKALKLGVANGAAVVTRVGSKTGLIKEKEIDNWLNKPMKISRQKK
ncbi:carbohydrate kinase family protein [Patescibacteria group bacterium]